MQDPDEWIRHKATLNHQWLANDLIVGLASYSEETVSEQSSAVRAKAPTWDDFRAEVEVLLGALEEAMSPRHLFNCGLLGALPEDYRRQSGDLAHAKWLLTEGIVEHKRSIQALVREIDVFFEAVDPTHSSSVSGKWANPFSRLIELLGDLSEELSALPNRLALP